MAPVNSAGDTLPTTTPNMTEASKEGVPTETITSQDLEGQAERSPSRKPLSRALFKPLPNTQPGPSPDGGLVAWIQVLNGVCVCAITWGIITSFGVFQTYYKTYLTPEPSESTISWIGTVQVFFMLFVGTFSGRASDAGYGREAILAGTTLIVFGLFMASLATEYYQLFLSHGVCVGIGMGTLFTPQLSVVSSYFTKKKPIAVGICSAGSGVGGLVFPAMAQQLLPRVGFGNTMRYIAVVAAVFAITINLLTRLRVPPRKSGPLVDWKAFAEPSFVTFCIGWFLIYWATYFAFYYIDAYGHAFTGLNSVDAVDLVLIINALGIPGRLFCGLVASFWLGSLNTAVIAAALAGTTSFCWIAVGHSVSGLWAFASVYGLFGSGVQALFGMSVAGVTDDLSQLGTRMGMVLSVTAFAALTGTPMAGAIIHASGGSYLGAQIWASISMLLGAVFLGAAQYLKTGKVLGWTK